MDPSAGVQPALTGVARLRRRRGRIMAMSAIGSLVAFAVSGGLGPRMTWSERLTVLIICTVYGFSIGLTAPFIMPAWVGRVARRGRISWWLARVLILPLMITVGGGTAFLILAAVGLVRPSSFWMMVFPYMRGGQILALVAAIFLAVTFYEYLRDRLDIASVALKTKELDEAEARRAAAEAQLASLESRVQPHFLFNTLNSIAALIPQDPKGAERMTEQLASLLRSSLDAGDALVPLERELKSVRDYLAIESVRFGARLRARFEIDEAVAEHLIPRLCLQTLVENSVKYAVAPRREGAAITVRAARRTGGIRLEVVDDGPGFDLGTVPNGHGIALVRDRLKLTLGAQAELSFHRDGGTTAAVIDIADVPEPVRA